MSATDTRTWTIDTIKAAALLAGSHFFEPATMRFFRSRILRTVYQGPGGIYFVTSEQFDDDTPRRYTVRRFDPADGSVDTFGDFNELGRAAAVTLAQLASSRSK